MAIDYTKRPSSPSSPASQTAAASLTKVTLTKASPSVSLKKQTGRMRVNLNWDARTLPPATTSIFKRRNEPSGIDLDLGCLYELTNGRKGAVQALGNMFGSFDSEPFILLSGDDRSGADVGGEDMYINLAHAQDIRRILVFANIYTGVASFDQANGVVTLEPADGAPIEVRLDEQAGGSRMCAIAMIEGNGGQLSVRREVRYIQGAQDALDKAYGWGMNWSRGRK
ncbi:MAG: putative tellurium resistance protein TerA [Frankiales bacterium]|nr:putative tellurium resistance protein TerA [Frankiales bacterium]